MLKINIIPRMPDLPKILFSGDPVKKFGKNRKYFSKIKNENFSEKPYSQKPTFSKKNQRSILNIEKLANCFFCVIYLK